MQLSGRLKQSNTLLQDGNKLKEDYGLSSTADGNNENNQARKAKGATSLSALIHSTRVGGAVLQNRAIQQELLYQLHSEVPEEKEVYEASIWKRLRWSLVSKARSEKLVLQLTKHTNTLNKFLRETQQLSALHDWRRIGLEAAGSIRDVDSLQLVQHVTRDDEYSTQMYSMTEKKTIDVSNSHASVIAAQVGTRSGPRALAALHMAEFDLSDELRAKGRFITTLKPSPLESKYFLFEKKSHGSEISSVDKQKLKDRLDRLILFLSSTSKSDDFNTLPCIGYCTDANLFCWWLVYQYPLSSEEKNFVLDPTHLNPPHPVSLSAYLFCNNPYKPALEQRLELACKVVKTFSELFANGWLHKGIRSENVVFLRTYDPKDPSSLQGFYDVSLPFLAGFEYSRQYAEQNTIDETPYNIRARYIPSSGLSRRSGGRLQDSIRYLLARTCTSRDRLVGSTAYDPGRRKKRYQRQECGSSLFKKYILQQTRSA